MGRMQINALVWGGSGAAVVCVQNRVEAIYTLRQAPSKSPNNQQQLPCYVNSALESTSPQIPLILKLLPAVQ